MKPNKVFIMLLITLLLLLVSCSESNVTDNQNLNGSQVTDNSIDNLISKAHEYVSKGEFNDAITIYNEVFDATKDVEIYEEIKKLKDEVALMKKVADFRLILKDIVENKVRKGVDINIHDLKVVTENLIETIDKFESIELMEDNPINEYVETIKNHESFVYLKAFTQEQYDKFLKKPLDPISSAGRLANTVVISILRDDIFAKYIPPILEIDTPSQLNEYLN